MAREPDQNVTLGTLHEDLRDLKGDVRDLTAVVASAVRAFPPEWPGEVIRVLRETNRLSEERFTQLDIALREQALETQTSLRAVAESLRAVAENLRAIAESHRAVEESQRLLHEEQRQLSAEIRALVARIDALIRGREDGGASR